MNKLMKIFTGVTIFYCAVCAVAWILMLLSDVFYNDFGMKCMLGGVMIGLSSVVNPMGLIGCFLNIIAGIVKRMKDREKLPLPVTLWIALSPALVIAVWYITVMFVMAHYGSPSIP